MVKLCFEGYNYGQIMKTITVVKPLVSGPCNASSSVNFSLIKLLISFFFPHSH